MQAVTESWPRYCVAILAVALALALSILLWPWVERAPTPLLFATALSALVRVYFFARPEYSLAFGPDEFLHLGVFVLAVVGVITHAG